MQDRELDGIENKRIRQAAKLIVSIGEKLGVSIVFFVGVKGHVMDGRGCIESTLGHVAMDEDLMNAYAVNLMATKQVQEACDRVEPLMAGRIKISERKFQRTIGSFFDDVKKFLTT